MCRLILKCQSAIEKGSASKAGRALLPWVSVMLHYFMHVLFVRRLKDSATGTGYASKAGRALPPWVSVILHYLIMCVV